MFDSLRAFATHIHRQLKVVGFSGPTQTVLRALLEVVYQASLRTEEGRYIQGSVTFADPAQPELIPPLTRRADYPGFTKLGQPIPLTPSNFVKLARAVDSWVGSIAVHGTTANSLNAWGIVDQLVHHNIQLHHESDGGAPNPGLVTIIIEGVGDLVAYHSGLFLGAIRHHELVRREHGALRSRKVLMQARSALQPFAKHIVKVLDHVEVDECLDELAHLWESTLARVAIGIRRKGTGGSLLISGAPLASQLSVGYPFRYERLRDSIILSVLDRNYATLMSDVVFESERDLIECDDVNEKDLSTTDRDDRNEELTGAVKLVTSLATIDGLVLMDAALGLFGFGVKIISDVEIGPVFDGSQYASRANRAPQLDLQRFGTRHTSMLRYCRGDPRAIGLVVSQDGHVRLIASVKSRGRYDLVLWDNVKTLSHSEDTAGWAQWTREIRAERAAHSGKASRGYTSTPKTVAELERVSVNRSPSRKRS